MTHRFRFLRTSGPLAFVALLFFAQVLHADPMYTYNGSVETAQLSLVVTANSSGKLFTTTASATNTSSQTLYNVFQIIDAVYVNGDNAGLVSPGDYTVSSDTALTADQVNAAAFLTASQFNEPIDTPGSATTPEIPAFLIASSLAPGQTVDFVNQFEVSSSSSSLEFYFYTATSPAPEPSSLLLLGTGVLAVMGGARRRIAA